jgi:hypothetical protein
MALRLRASPPAERGLLARAASGALRRATTQPWPARRLATAAAPASGAAGRRLTVVLDMDECLIHSTGFSDEVAVGIGRILALYYHSSTLYQIHEHIRCLYF